MTEPITPETPSEVAKRLWDTAIRHLDAATTETDVGVANAYVKIAELSLHAAQFAISNPGLLLGIPVDDGQGFGLPSGAPPLPESILPKVWGR